MENLGALAILLAFCLSVYAIGASLVGKWKQKPFLTLSAERSVFVFFVLLASASGFFFFSLIVGDFRLAYVAAHSNRTMSTVYKFTAWWGGQAGSLLLWAVLLSCYSAVVV